MQGLADLTRLPESTCPFCGIPFAARSNLAITRQLPVGLGLLMGAFVASQDASPMRRADSEFVTGFARAFPK